VTSLTLFWICFRISMISFGGVFGVLPEFQRAIVVDHHFMSADDFVSSLMLGQLVPGPNMAMCALIGYRVDGVSGAIAAGAGIYSGPTLLMFGAAALYRRLDAFEWVRRTELALRPIAAGLIASSVLVMLVQVAPQRLAPLLVVAALCAWLKLRSHLGTLSILLIATATWLLVTRLSAQAFGS
jgi:chromate transporter